MWVLWTCRDRMLSSSLPRPTAKACHGPSNELLYGSHSLLLDEGKFVFAYIYIYIRIHTYITVVCG